MAAITKQEALILARLSVKTKLAEELSAFGGQNVSADDIDTSRTFTDPEPDGYGRTELRYLHLVEVIADDLRARSHRNVHLNDAFANAHTNKPLDDFIFDAADVVMGSAPTA